VIRAGFNKVLVKPLKENNFIVKDGVVFYLDTSYSKERHAITFGEIVSNPSSISSDFRTDIETKEGDIVFFHYLATLNAIRDKKFIKTEGEEILYSVSYDSLYCAKRGEDIICLNGFILVRPLATYSNDKIGNVYLPESMLKKEQAGRGMVAHAGNPLNGEKKLVESGDEILYRKTSNVPIEYPLHQQMERYFRMKNDSILAISQSVIS